MSFRKTITHETPYKTVSIQPRKEQDSLKANHFHSSYHTQPERASVFTSKGSITLEAAVVVPIFFFAMVCISYLFEIMAIQTDMRNALYNVGREWAQKAYVSTLISHQDMEQEIVSIIGRERLERSMVVAGAEGLDCSRTRNDVFTGELRLSLCYQLNIPVLMFRIPIISQEETLKVKGWNGYINSFSLPETEEKVYLTNYGLVYHKDRNCSYLEVSVRAVDATKIQELRNVSGGKYYPCLFCKNTPSKGGKLYVSDFGKRYHNSLECSRIKRNVYAVPLDEVYGLGGCSKCVK